jgi:hypothetical protein
MGAQVSTAAATNLALIRMWLEGNRQTAKGVFEGGAQAGMSYIIAPLPVCLTAVAQLGWLVLSRHVRRQLDATSREGGHGLGKVRRYDLSSQILSLFI